MDNIVYLENNDNDIDLENNNNDLKKNDNEIDLENNNIDLENNDINLENNNINLENNDIGLENNNINLENNNINLEIDNIVYLENDNIDLENDLYNGQVYIIKNKLNNKCYIGQACCFTGSNNLRWGTNGRWKSHLREALNTNQNHCVILNNAIRKYADNIDGTFEIKTLIKCPIEELDKYEEEYILKFNTVSPNGYNLKKGGSTSKFSEETKKRMSLAHLGKKRNVENNNNYDNIILTSQNINNKLVKVKINKLTQELPEFIFPHYKKDKLIGYYVEGLYNHKCEEIPRKYFNGKTNRWNLNDAIKFIELVNHFISNNITIADSYIDEIEVSGKSNKNLHEKYHLPKYVNVYNYKNEFKGFMINGYPSEKYKSKKFKKVFSNPKLTLDENYNDCITFLNELKINSPIINNKYQK